MITKNVANQKIPFRAENKTTGLPATGLASTSFVAVFYKDGSASAAQTISGSGTAFVEVANGWYWLVEHAQGSVNADSLIVDITNTNTDIVCTGIACRPEPKTFRNVYDLLVVAGASGAGSTVTNIAVTGLASYSADALEGSVIVFIEGAASHQPRVVDTFDGSFSLTVDTALSTAPADGDRFLILGKGV